MKMAMYIPDEDTITVNFEGRPGLEVKFLSLSLGEVEHMQDFSLTLTSKENVREQKIFKFLEGKLVSWNVGHVKTCMCGAERGDPIPPTVDGMLCMDLMLLRDIVQGWIQSIVQVSRPKELSSNNGVQTTLSEEAKTNLDKLLNQMKLPEPNFI
jgi:hypothetical protein